MISPFELGSLYLCLPLVFLFIWYVRRSDAVGAGDPEFEAWCADRRPVLFAIKLDAANAEGLVADVVDALRDGVAIEHHRGRYPWTRYVFDVHVELSSTHNVIVARALRCTLRRGEPTGHELGAILDEITAAIGDRAEALWIHADLREEDEESFDRRNRGWTTTFEGGAAGPFVRTKGLPAWAEITDRGSA